jgi:hypothetical protein
MACFKEALTANLDRVEKRGLNGAWICKRETIERTSWGLSGTTPSPYIHMGGKDESLGVA